MTTTETSAPGADANKKRKNAILLLSLFVAVLALVGVAFGFMSHYMSDSRASQSNNMQKSLEAHGFKADAGVAKLVSDGCRYKADAYPVSTTIVHDYNGKKSVITFMCDGNSKISDFAAVPAT